MEMACGVTGRYIVYVIKNKKVKECPETGATFAYFKEPWVFFETADEYTEIFEKHWFNQVLSKIDSVKMRYTPE